MWLVEITINSTMHRVSTVSSALTYFWDGKIIEFNPLGYSMREETGGYIEPRFGGASFSPALFASDWPPPLHCAIDVKYTESDESSAIEVFSGHAHRSRIGRDSIDYDFWGDIYDESIVSTVINKTLVTEFADFCDPGYLNLTLDSTAARDPSPTLSIPSNSQTVPVIDLMSKSAAAVNHCFYIKSGVLYLIDMLAANGTYPYTEFDFMPVEYIDRQPYILFRSAAQSVFGSQPHGEIKELDIDEYVGSSAIATHLAGAKTIFERIEISMTLPTTPDLFLIFGGELSWTDESMGPEGESITASMRVRAMTVDPEGEFVTLTGDGAIS